MFRPRIAGQLLRRSYSRTPLRWQAAKDLSASAAATQPSPAGEPPSKAPAKQAQVPAADHRDIGVQQELFTTSVYSSGSPIFLPRGALIFNRLVQFLRSQYAYFGFDEVITPTIYKKALWERSGHLQNYADDMYSVTSRSRARDTTTSCCGNATHEGATGTPIAEDDNEAEWGLKPMNCPGHCLIFKSKKRSYRDLPIRYADFSSLHRNEISGALSGLTRVRRFHQDDGHIFCRPSQVEDEIRKTLDFVKVVYTVLKLPAYRFALSTRPKDHFIGEADEWDRAEAALRRVLDASGIPWMVNEGDGAFYGPKIDVVLRDSDGKEHQTATIQLDFQLPKRFGLEYTAPAPESERRGEITDDLDALKTYGPVTPVLVHRAVLGSVERLMALLMEEKRGKWPFWLNPRQAVVVTVNDSPAVVQHAQWVQSQLTGVDGAWFDKVKKGISPADVEKPLRPTGLAVDLDDSTETLRYKIRDAQQKGYAYVLIVGERNVKDGNVTVGKTDMDAEAVRDMLLSLRETFQ